MREFDALAYGDFFAPFGCDDADRFDRARSLLVSAAAHFARVAVHHTHDTAGGGAMEPTSAASLAAREASIAAAQMQLEGDDALRAARARPTT